MTTFLDTKSAAKKLHINPKTLENWARTGKIPAAKICGRWQFIEEDIASFIRSQYDTSATLQGVIDEEIKKWHSKIETEFGIEGRNKKLNLI